MRYRVRGTVRGCVKQQVRGGVVCPLRQAAVRVSVVHLYYRLDQNQSELIGTNPNQSESIGTNRN